jgi:hypothetical protein
LKKVALVGFAAKTKEVVWPDNVEIWTINYAWNYDFVRIDRLLEMHPIEHLSEDNEQESKHWLWLQEPHEFPIYMMHKDPRVPASVEYPLDDICDDCFSHIWRFNAMNRYLTSSASFMMAMAIHEQYNAIYLSGFEMATGSEYTYQRDGLAYLTGLANGRGISVVLPSETGFLKAKIYSYEGGQLVSREVVQEHLNNYKTQAGVLSNSIDTTCHICRLKGAVRALTTLLNNFSRPSMGRQGLEHLCQKYNDQLRELIGYVNKLGPDKFGSAMAMAEGAVQAYENLIKVCDLEEPDFKIREIAHIIQSENITDPSPGYVDFSANTIKTGGIWR